MLGEGRAGGKGSMGQNGGESIIETGRDTGTKRTKSSKDGFEHSLDDSWNRIEGFFESV